MRIQLDLPESKVNELKALMKETGTESYKDFFNSALTMTKWAIREVENGRIIASLDEDTGKYKELVMPILEAATVTAAQKKETNLATAGHGAT